jgi:hypothetical protein
MGRRPHPNDLPCTDCSHVWAPGERRHEYDHHLGYAAEHHLDVEPVCTTCHAARDWKKEVCKRGHLLSESSRQTPKGRECVLCRRERDMGRRDAAWWRARRARKKATASNG